MSKQLTLEEALALQRARQKRRQQQLQATEQLRTDRAGGETAAGLEPDADPQD